MGDFTTRETSSSLAGMTNRILLKQRCKTSFRTLFWFFCLFLFLSEAWSKSAQAPVWYDIPVHAKLIEARRKAEGLPMGSAPELQKFDSKKIKIGNHSLTSTVAVLGDYTVSEIFSNPPQSGKPLFQVIDKNGCGVKAVEDVTTKKLGARGEIGFFFTQVKLVPPNCPKSEINSPKVFILLQETQKSLEKVFESAESEDGKYDVHFEKDVIHLDYTKTGQTKSSLTNLLWDEKIQRWVEQP